MNAMEVGIAKGILIKSQLDQFNALESLSCKLSLIRILTKDFSAGIFDFPSAEGV